jgi:quercetin dioxygenase-like cupin family protein
MTLLRTWIVVAALLAGTAFVPSHKVAAQTSADTSQNNAAELDRIAFSHDLPRLDGAHLKVTIVEVTYGPGGSSPPHSHPCAVIGYVIQGAYQTQVKGEKEAIYQAGESFYEAPNGVHMISANASKNVPVKFLAYFVCDRDAPLDVAPPEAPPSGGNH